MSETKQSLLPQGNLLLAAVVALGIVLPGMARRFLGETGYNDFRMVVFTFGYAGTVAIVWCGWVRPLDITDLAE